MICECLIGCLFLAVAALAAIVMDFLRARKSENHTLLSLIHQYLVQSGLQLVGSLMYVKLQHDSKRCRKIQEELLLSILKQNRNTEYGKEHKFSEIKSREQFIEAHPITRYEDYKSYVAKIADGAKNILSSKKVKMLSVTSGTSGSSNLIPSTPSVFRTFFLYGISVFSYCMVKSYPQVRQLQKVLKFFYTPKQRKSSAGIQIGPNSSSPANSKRVLPLYSTPAAGYEIMTEHEAQYVHLLFALKDRCIGAIEANFASILLNAFLSLRYQWQQLVEDIRYGRLSPNLNVSEEIRRKLDQQLKADPKRAKELEEEFTVGFEAIAKRIWPHLNIVLTTDTGSMKLYGDILKSVYTKDITHYSPLYAATEGLIGVNIWPSDVKTVYMLIPKAMFFEFIPIEDVDKKEPTTVFTDQVKVGDSYELVITTESGLCRYRLGDVVKIQKLYHQTPVVEFKYRQGQILNIRGEKMSEQVFDDALADCCAQWSGKRILDYCLAESSLVDKVADIVGSKAPSPRYVLFLEMENEDQLTEEEALQLDHFLRVRHWVYNSFRSKGSISASMVLHVRKGTFLELRHFLLANSDASPNQIKIPRVIHKEEILKFLFEHLKI